MTTNVKFIYKDNEFVIPSTLKNSITCLDIVPRGRPKMTQYFESTSNLKFKKGNSNHSFYWVPKQKIKNIEKQKIKPDNKLYDDLENPIKEHQIANNYPSKMSNPCDTAPHFIKNDKSFHIQCNKG